MSLKLIFNRKEFYKLQEDYYERQIRQKITIKYNPQQYIADVKTLETIQKNRQNQYETQTQQINDIRSRNSRSGEEQEEVNRNVESKIQEKDKSVRVRELLIQIQQCINNRIEIDEKKTPDRGNVMTTQQTSKDSTKSKKKTIQQDMPKSDFYKQAYQNYKNDIIMKVSKGQSQYDGKESLTYNESEITNIVNKVIEIKQDTRKVQQIQQLVEFNMMVYSQRFAINTIEEEPELILLRSYYSYINKEYSTVIDDD